MSNKEIRGDFASEKSIFEAVPLMKMSKSWVNWNDVGDKGKSTELHYAALNGKKLYMVKVNEKYAKLYIVDSKNIWRVFVENDTICPDEKYHGN